MKCQKNKIKSLFGNKYGIIILFLFCFMGGNGFGGRGDIDRYATAASQQEILFGQQFQGLDNKIDRIGNGIADATFALNNTILGASSALGNSVTSEGRALQTQLANCCCENREAVAQARYDAAMNTQALLASNAEQTQKILDVLATNRMADMQNQINQLQLQSALCGVMRYPQATTYTAGYAPYYAPQPACGCGC